MSSILKNIYKLPFTAINVYPRDKLVSNDTIYSDTPAIDGGYTCAQLSVGEKSVFSDAYGMKTDNYFLNTLEDNIRGRGSMIKLISDSAQYDIRNCAQSILRELFIDDCQSKPHYQHQNFY